MRRCHFMHARSRISEQYILAQFMKQGYFEKHINRMRLFYGRKRARVLEIIKNTFTAGMYRIIENDSGLHFIFEINTELPDGIIKERLKKKRSENFRGERL